MASRRPKSYKSGSDKFERLQKRKEAASSVLDALIKTCKGSNCEVRSSQASFTDGYCPKCEQQRHQAKAQAAMADQHYLSIAEGDFS